MKILSWNIQKLGLAKVSDPGVGAYIVELILQTDADVVGVMELVGFEGNGIVQRLVAGLNAGEAQRGSPRRWDGASSEMTPSCPNEQYAFLWRTDVITPLERSLANVVGDMAWEALFRRLGWDRDDHAISAAFYESLMAHGYITPYYTITKEGKASVDAGAPVDLSGGRKPFPLSTNLAVEIGQLLARSDLVGFPTAMARPPYQMRVQRTDGSVLYLLLFHAPGPGSALPVIVSNLLTLLPAVVEAPAAVVMGDFNVTWAEQTKGMTLQYWDHGTRRLDYVRGGGDQRDYVGATPFQSLTGGPYAKVPVRPPIPLIPPGRYYVETLPRLGKTTLVGSAGPGGYRSREYDRFFVRPPGPATARVVDPIGGADRTPRLGELAVWAHNGWWEAHYAEAQRTRDQAAVDRLQREIPLIDPCKGITTLEEAFYTYRSAISDHLPILLEIP